jgi:hypothetical protein
VYFFNIIDSRTGKSSINKFPAESYFYDIPELEDEKQILEHFFSNIEGGICNHTKKHIGTSFCGCR